MNADPHRINGPDDAADEGSLAGEKAGYDHTPWDSTPPAGTEYPGAWRSGYEDGFAVGEYRRRVEGKFRAETGKDRLRDTGKTTEN